MHATHGWQHTRSLSMCSLQLALPLMGKHSKYTFVGTCSYSKCLDVLAGITEVCDTTGACVSRVSIQRPLADVERLLVLQRSVKKLPLPCNNRCVPGCARRATHCMDEPNFTSLCLPLYKGSRVMDSVQLVQSPSGSQWMPHPTFVMLQHPPSVHLAAHSSLTTDY